VTPDSAAGGVAG